MTLQTEILSTITSDFLKQMIIRVMFERCFHVLFSEFIGWTRTVVHDEV